MTLFCSLFIDRHSYITRLST